MTTVTSRTVSIATAAQELGVCEMTILRMIRRGEIQVIKLPGVRRRLIPSSELDRLVGSPQRR